MPLTHHIYWGEDTQATTRSKNAVFLRFTRFTFEAQEVESLTARCRKKLKLLKVKLSVYL